MKINVREIVGFTLIELLIAVAIVGILAAVAYPSYFDSVQKSRRVDAVNYLLFLQMEQEKYRASNPQYAANLSDLPNISTNSVDSPDGYYTVTMVSGDETTFVARATAKTGTSQASDTGCTQFDINQNGPVDNGNSCWNK